MNNRNLLQWMLGLGIVVLLASACGVIEAPSAVERYIIKDYVPSVDLNEITQSRFLVTTNDAGQLEAEVRLPSHRQEMIFLNTRVTLGVGNSPFEAPPQSLEQQAPSPNFTAGMVTPDWFSGAEHIMIGKIAFGGYIFDSDPSYPLTFKVIKELGYVYISGRGTVATPEGNIRELGKNDTIASWIKLASSSDQLDREGAAEALGYLYATGSENEKQSAIAKLSEMLKDNAFEVRRDAIESLAQIGAVDVIPSLKQMAEKDENEWVRAVAEWAVSKIEGKSP